MNAPAHTAESTKKSVASSSPRGSVGTSASALGRGCRRARRSTIPARSQRASLLMEAPPDHQRDADQRRSCDQPRDEPLWHWAYVTDAPAALVRRVLRVLDVEDDRVELAVADLRAPERRHHVWPVRHGLGDLCRG